MVPAVVVSLVLLCFVRIVAARTGPTDGSSVPRAEGRWGEGEGAKLLPKWMRGQRILASTACYGHNPRKEGYMRAALQEMASLADAGMSVVMSIDVTDAWDGVFENTTEARVKVVLRRFDPGIRFALVQRFQELWARSVADFDWFLFFEDDLRVSADLIVGLITETRLLADTMFYPGPIRAEYDRTGRQYIADMSTCTPPQVTAMWRVGERVYVEPRDPYSAFTLVNRSIVAAALDTGEWPRSARKKVWCKGRTLSRCEDRTFREQNS
eukprot:Hpha_TRINITY_DN16932_c0_g2::TRINITY_DN16932_c0_g2_i1::g.51568::m.51568